MGSPPEYELLVVTCLVKIKSCISKKNHNRTLLKRIDFSQVDVIIMSLQIYMNAFGNMHRLYMLSTYLVIFTHVRVVLLVLC